MRGVLRSMLGMIRNGATHIAVATDHVIESFRNQLWPGYKTGDGIETDLLGQFPLLEETLTAAGIVVWPMIEYEADDALAAAAGAAVTDDRVERVLICTPDKDLAQSIRGERVVQLNRRTRAIRDEAGVIRDFGVLPASIPDYLALVGDAADGYPGLAGWGAKSTAAVLSKFGHIESIPVDWGFVGRCSCKRVRTCSHALQRTKSGSPVPDSCNASDRYRAVSRCRATQMDWPDCRVCGYRRASRQRDYATSTYQFAEGFSTWSMMR